MPRSRAQLFGICDIIWKSAPTPVRQLSVDIRRSYARALEGRVEFIASGSQVTGDQLLRLWMNGVLFHDDEDSRRSFAALLADDIDGAILTGAIVGVVLWLAKCVLDLDDVLADWLEEDRLPRARAAR